jgi:NitT/TauT family transport system substrate-binding protein
LSKPRKTLPNLLWVVPIVFVIGSFFLSKQVGQQSNQLPTVKLGLQTTPAVALVIVAVGKQFFKTEGIEVEVKEFTGGKFALQALIGGSLDLVTPAEFPVTLATLNDEKLAILAQVNETAGAIQMILRKEGDSFDAQTYFSKKRRIATSVGASPEFFTADFFKNYDIRKDQYEIVSMKPEDTPIALANGSVDGIAIYEPFVHFAIQQTHHDKVFRIKNDDLYSEVMILVGKREWILRNEKVVEKFIRALKHSEIFIKDNPEEAMDIVASFTKLDKGALRDIWPTFKLELGLDKRLVPIMEKEAKWAKDTGKVPKEIAMPKFREAIFETPLKEVAPSQVKL